jgi:DNA repair protein RAD5
MNKERNLSDREDVSMHPLWEEYNWPTQDQDGNEIPPVEGLDQFYVNPYSGELSLDFPRQEQNCLGGILADEMGLGKTSQSFLIPLMVLDWEIVPDHRPPCQCIDG